MCVMADGTWGFLYPFRVSDLLAYGLRASRSNLRSVLVVRSKWLRFVPSSAWCEEMRGFFRTIVGVYFHDVFS